MMRLDAAIFKVRVLEDGRPRGCLSLLLPFFVLALASAAPLRAQTCSGGVDGGMDATGNLCNATVAAMSTASTEGTGKAVQERDAASGKLTELSLRKRSPAPRRVLVEARDAEARRSLGRGTK